jgi:hypothetical protein
MTTTLARATHSKLGDWLRYTDIYFESYHYPLSAGVKDVWDVDGVASAYISLLSKASQDAEASMREARKIINANPIIHQVDEGEFTRLFAVTKDGRAVSLTSLWDDSTFETYGAIYADAYLKAQRDGTLEAMDLQLSDGVSRELSVIASRK